MNGEGLPVGIERIVVALDTSPQSTAALRAAVELAARMDVELEGLFVEDASLFYLCGFPSCREVGSHTALSSRIEGVGMERQLRAQAAVIREAMQRATAQSTVRWSLRVRRGAVLNELLAAAQGAAVMGIGRAGRAHQRRIGSIAKGLVAHADRPLLISGEGGRPGYPLTVLYTGTDAARRALALALRLSGGEAERVRVVLPVGAAAAFDADQLEQAVRRLLEANGAEPLTGLTVTKVDEPGEILDDLRGREGGTLVLPQDQAHLVEEYEGTALLVP